MEKIKVRLALEINPDGKWQAYGWHGEEADWAAAMDGLEAIDGRHGKRYWIEAEVEMPAAEPETVKGEAVPA